MIVDVEPKPRPRQQDDRAYLPGWKRVTRSGGRHQHLRSAGLIADHRVVILRNVRSALPPVRRMIGQSHTAVLARSVHGM